MWSGLTRRVMEDEEGKTSGRKERLRGQMGVRTSAESDGCTIGPPALREYAVEPVGVDTISPSDYKECLHQIAYVGGENNYPAPRPRSDVGRQQMRQ